jgi:hypothetical protein
VGKTGRKNQKLARLGKALQTDGLGYFVKLIAANLFEAFAGGGELLIDLDNLFGHHLVGFPGPTRQQKIFARRETFVAITIRRQAKHYGLFARLFSTGI